MNRKRLFIFIVLTLFVFMNNVDAKEQLICEYTTSKHDFNSLRLIRDYETVLVDSYLEAYEKFKVAHGKTEYVVTLELEEPKYYKDEDRYYVDNFTFIFKWDNLSIFFNEETNSKLYGLAFNSMMVYSFSYSSYSMSYEYYSGNTTSHNYPLIQTTGDDYCVANSLALFTGTADLKLPDIDDTESTEYFWPVFNNASYDYQSLGTLSFPYITDNYLPEITSTSYKELSLNVSDYLILYPTIYDIGTTSFEASKTQIFAKGQFCLTPVYEYGTTEKANPSSNPCYSYDDYTAITISMSQEDLENHVVFYVSNYDGKGDSSIKIRTSFFNYKYFYYDDIPTLHINGNSYNAISYDKLQTTAKTNTTDGVIPGVSCQLGDLACTAENDPNVSGFDNLIDNILDFGSSIWSSVVNFMSLVTKLITVLPPDFQQVILICFTFGLIIGCVKIFIK